MPENYEKLPTVSVIIPTYNRANLIGKTIQSVVRQTYVNIEIIIIDDGSEDNTVDIVNESSNAAIKSNKKLRYFYQDHTGACVARNRGLKMSSGEFVMFLDSDDLLTPNKIEVQVEIMELNSTPCAICDFEYVDSDGTPFKKIKNDGDIHEYVKNLRSPALFTSLIRKNSISPTLQWNPSLKRNQDMDFMFKYFCCIKDWSYTPGYFCKYVQHNQDQISNTYYKGMQYLVFMHSMNIFFKQNREFIPPENMELRVSYIKKLAWLWFKSLIPKNIKIFARLIPKDS